MSNTLALSNNEETILNKVAAGRTSGLSEKEVQELVGALIKAAPDIFKKVLAIIHDDVKLQKDIVNHFHATALKTIDTNNKMTREILENGSQNSEIIRELIRMPNQTYEQTEALLIELRFYFEEMQKAATETQIRNERVQQNEHAIAQSASARSSRNRNLAIGTGAVAVFSLGMILRPFLDSLIHNVHLKS